MIYLVANKQDGATLRTAKDLELKYNFGQSFAEIYGLIDDTRTAAEEAVDELDNELDFEEIFNRLTNYGAVQTIYREDDNIYINASYIKSGTLAADLVDAANLEVNAAKIYGTLDAGDVTITNLSANSITGGTLDAGMVNIMNLSADSITSGTLNANYVTISNLSASNIISSGDITWSMLSSGVQSEIDNAYTMAESAQDTVDGWTYGSTTYIDGEKIKTGTVYASYLKGGSIELLNSSGQTAGSLTLSGSSSYSGQKIVMSSGAIEISTTYGSIYLESDNGASIQLSSYTQFGGGNIRCGSNGSYSCGTSGYAWKDVYATNSAIQTSDANQKNSIEILPDKYLAMLDTIEPKRFKLNSGTSNRYHVGFIAQDVETAMTSAGVSAQEFGGWVKDVDNEGNDIYMLRYGEFIGLLLAKIKKLEARITALEG